MTKGYITKQDVAILTRCSK